MNWTMAYSRLRRGDFMVNHLQVFCCLIHRGEVEEQTTRGVIIGTITERYHTSTEQQHVSKMTIRSWGGAQNAWHIGASPAFQQLGTANCTLLQESTERHRGQHTCFFPASAVCSTLCSVNACTVWLMILHTGCAIFCYCRKAAPVNAVHKPSRQLGMF